MEFGEVHPHRVFERHGERAGVDAELRRQLRPNPRRPGDPRAPQKPRERERLQHTGFREIRAPRRCSRERASPAPPPPRRWCGHARAGGRAPRRRAVPSSPRGGAPAQATDSSVLPGAWRPTGAETSTSPMRAGISFPEGVATDGSGSRTAHSPGPGVKPARARARGPVPARACRGFRRGSGGWWTQGACGAPARIRSCLQCGT